MHEANHALGITNEAEANCLAAQDVWAILVRIGKSPRQADRGVSLALAYGRATAPPGYWDEMRCSAGGEWDIHPPGFLDGQNNIPPGTPPFAIGIGG
jgi:hypothetical protein